MIEPGAPVVIATPDFAGLCHLPVPELRSWKGRPGLGRLEERLRQNFPPPEWPTLCGLAGGVYRFAGELQRRKLCSVCAARGGVAIAKPPAAPARKRKRQPKITPELRERIGFGGRRYEGRRFTLAQVDRLYELYCRGASVPMLARHLYARFGYSSPEEFRHALEYAWRTQGRKRRDNREAELFSRARPDRPYCKALKTGSDGRRPRPCTQRPLQGSEYCLHHDPDHQAEVEARAAALRARKPDVPKVPWELVRPYLGPLLVPRVDRFGRRLEKPGGALARQTGVAGGICSRLMLGRHQEITVELANRLLAPLDLTVDDLLGQRAA